MINSHKIYGLIFFIVIFCFSGCQLEPRKLKFNPPHVLEDVSPAVPKLSFRGFTPFKAFYSREINGVDSKRIIKNFLGGPNKRIESIDEVQSWIYIFQRVKPGLRPPHDARRIEFTSGNPPNIAVSVVVKDNRVQSTQAAWFGYTPVSVSDVIRFLGNPDKRVVITGGEEFYYRYVCFTSHVGGSEETSYIQNESIVKITFQASGNYDGFDLYFVDRSKVVIFPDGTVQDPAMNVVWSLVTPTTSEKKAGLDLITYGLKGLERMGDVAAAFGWASDVLSSDRPGSTKPSSGYKVQTSIYPLKREKSPPIRMVITSKAKEEIFEVVSMGLSWEGDMPRTSQELKVKFGEPDRIDGSIASGFQRWIYNYQLMVEPFVRGHLGKNKFGISIMFSIRSGINLDSQVEIKKLYY